VIKVLIFDLCDTVVRTAGVDALLQLPGLRSCYDAEGVDEWFRGNPVYYAYEKGEATTQQFLESMRRDLCPTADPNELARVYEHLILHEIDGVAELLTRLGGTFPLCALSNNNPLLWRGIRRVYPSLALFGRIFLSHEIGLLKPHPAAFMHILEQVGCAAEEAVLVDDNPTCIARAEALGMKAIHFCSAFQVRGALDELFGEEGIIC
jgi:glucose-1-phosphatase